MAVAYRSAGTATNSAGGNITPGLPAGYAADDIFILICETAAQALSAPSGYSEHASSPVSSTTNTRLHVFWKRASASESAPTVTGAADHTIGQILAFSGCIASGSPFDSNATTDASSGASTTINWPTFNTTVANVMPVLFAAVSADTTTASVGSYTNSATEQVESRTTSGNGGGVVAATLPIMAIAGATGTTTATVGSQAWATLAVGLKPAATAHDLTATDLATGAPSSGSPAIGQVHGLSASPISTGTPSLASPSLAQAHALGATTLATGQPSIGSPSFGQAHALTAAGIATAPPSIGAPALGSNAVDLVALGFSTLAPVIDSPALGQGHALQAISIGTGAPTFGMPAMNFAALPPSTARTVASPIYSRTAMTAVSSRTVKSIRLPR